VPRARVAALAARVVEKAEAGDAAAQIIMNRNVDALVEMVATVAARLRLERPEVVITGGLLDNAAAFRQMFLHRLARTVADFRLVPPALPPVLGAVLLAVQITAGKLPPTGFLQNLRETSLAAFKHQP
jgi:N-acetylglucosamine kinase-like BadF-type ATPase